MSLASKSLLSKVKLGSSSIADGVSTSVRPSVVTMTATDLLLLEATFLNIPQLEVLSLPLELADTERVRLVFLLKRDKGILLPCTMTRDPGSPLNTTQLVPMITHVQMLREYFVPRVYNPNRHSPPAPSWVSCRTRISYRQLSIFIGYVPKWPLQLDLLT